MKYKRLSLLLAALAVSMGLNLTPLQAIAADTGNTTTTSETSEDDEDEDEEEIEEKKELASAVLTEKPNAKKLGAAGGYVMTGESGSFDIDRSYSKYIEEDDLDILTRLTWFSSDATILTVDSSTGTYRGIKAGNVSVTVYGYADYKSSSMVGAYESDELFHYTVKLSVLPDLKNITFDKTEESIFINAKGMAKASDDVGVAEFTLSGTDYIFDGSKDAGAIAITADTKYFSYKMEENVLKLYCSKAGDVNVTVNIGPVSKELVLHVTKVKQSGSVSQLLVQGKSTGLKLLQVSKSGGSSQKVDPSLIEWSSSNSRVTVDSSGRVRAKKLGASCIKAKYQGYTYYWVVNVSSAKKAKVIAVGRDIAKGTYSQPRRMQQGFYDCSSLVWRAYKPYGYNFGSNTYAPVAASEANYLYNRGKMIAGAIGKSNTQKLKLRPGDLLFEGGAANGRWGGIYHVEMFAGYTISSVGSDGKPVYANTWVNRTDGCYGYGTANDYVGRP